VAPQRGLVERDVGAQAGQVRRLVRHHHLEQQQQQQKVKHVS
jgi:hypothetical protein